MTQVLDGETGEIRDAELSDLADFARLTDGLDHLVISNEIVGAVRRVIEGFEVNEDTLGVDAITRVGIGGNYLQDEHTFKYLRSKRFNPLFVKPQTKVSWRESGSKGILETARERALTILKEHQPAPLDQEIAAGLRKVIEEAERAFGVKRT